MRRPLTRGARIFKIAGGKGAGHHNGEVAKALERPETIDKLNRGGSTPLAGSSQSYSDYSKSEHAKWEKVVCEANIKLE